MGDLISRQAAIRKLKRMAIHANIYKLTGRAETVINCCIDVIERQIPSAQPESEERKAESAQNVPKEDLISRKAAIDGKISIQRANGVEIYSDEAVPVEYLKRLPSVQPEIIRCKDCENWIPGYITDNDDFIPPRCGRLRQTMRISGDDYCSFGERRTG